GSDVLRRVLEVWPSTGSGFSTNPVFSLTLGPNDIEESTFRAFDWGDPDGDGDLDLVITPFGPERRAAVFLNQSGVFTNHPDWISQAVHVESAAFGNLNNDGMDDLLIGVDVNNRGTSSRMDIHLHNGTPGGPGPAPTWSDLSPGTDANGNPVQLSWTDFDRDNDNDVSVFTRHAVYAYRNTGGSLPANYSFFVAQNGASKPSHLLQGWANIDGSGLPDLWGTVSVIRNAGSFSGPYSDSNLGVWEHLVTHPFYNVGIDFPWRRVSASFSDLHQAVDLTGDGVAELIVDNANMVLLNTAGTFPFALEEVPDRLVTVPPGPIFLDKPGDSIALSVYAVYTNGTSNNVTTDALWDIAEPDDGVEVIRMSNNVVIAVRPTSSGRGGLTADWTSLEASFNVVVGNAPLIPESLRIVPGISTITRPGELLPFSAILTYEGGAEADVTPETGFTSSNPGSVQLNGSVGMALGNGTSQITGDILGLSATATVNVAISVGILGLSVSPPQSSIPVGGTRNYEVRIHYGDGSSEVVTFFSTLTSMDPAIASIGDRTATGLSRGFTGIQANYEGLIGTAELAVYDEGDPWLVIPDWSYASSEDVTLRWFAAPPLGLTNHFTVEFSTNLLLESYWLPIETGVSGTPFGFMNWSGSVPTNAPRGHLRIRTEP
ncbi:MAG: FG-GAP-like repeat-containing protein, partial [Verrucomicrobiota bacterium]